MQKRISKFTSVLMILAITILFTNDTVSAAAYYNTYDTLAIYTGKGYCGIMEGAAVDRTNNRMYSAKINADSTKSQIICYNIGTKKSNAPVDTSSYSLNHANDIAAIPDGTSTLLYVSTLTATGPSVVKLKAASNGKITKVKSYNVSINGKKVSVGSITYDQDNKVFILGAQGAFYIGTFNETNNTFNVKSSFKTDLTKVSINGAAEADYSKYTHQGVCYYKGNFYVPLLNPDRKCQSVVVVYKVNTKQLMTNTDITKPTVVSPRKDLSFRVTSSAYSVLFELEAIDFGKDGTMYFSTNRRKDADTQSDMIGNFKDYKA